MRNRRQGRDGVCPCCGRTLTLTFHHLIPKKVHRRPRFKKRYDKKALAQGVMLCRACHAGIHRAYDEVRLAQELNTLDKLRADPLLARHFAWVGRQRTPHGPAPEP